MSIEPIEFLRAATAMLTPKAGEVDFRNAASRAYYSAYHWALELALDIQAKVATSGGSHELIIKTLIGAGNNPFDLKCRRVGYLLSSMRETRHRADYQLDINFMRLDAEQVIESCTTTKVTIDEALIMKA